MRTLALIQNKTVLVCCLCRIDACSTLLRLIMVRMSDWALPFMTLSLSLATSSSSGPRGGISVLPHHGLKGEEQVQTVSFTCTQTAKLLVFLYRRQNYFHIYLFQLHLEVILYTFCSLRQATRPLCTLRKYLDHSGYQSTGGLWQSRSSHVKKTEDAQRVFCPQRESFLTYLKRMKNLYCSKTVKMKKITPSIAIANKFFPTKSHCRGSRVCFAPKEGKKNKMTNFYI